MSKINKDEEDKSIDYIQIIIVSISIVLILYSCLYIYLYYDYNDILRHFPKNYNTEYKKLSPNEIGDSIGGTLNPIIGITASILTFLAFYIQYKSNKQQVDLFKKQIINEKLKENERITERHKITLRIFKSLISQMISYYKESGDNLKKFILIEHEKPLDANIFKFLTDASYVYFKEVSFTEIYEAMIWYFNLNNNHINDWEDEFTQTLTKIDFYDKLITDLKQKYLDHIKSKTSTLNDVGFNLDEKMGEILSDEDFLKNSSKNGIDHYFRIIHNQDKDGKQISENFKGIDFQDLQINFFSNFLENLLHEKNVLEYLNRNKTSFDKKDPALIRTTRILEDFSKLNKKIGTEKLQTLYYVNNLEEYFETYFSENSIQLESISDFISRIDTK